MNIQFPTIDLGEKSGVLSKEELIKTVGVLNTEITKEKKVIELESQMLKTLNDKKETLKSHSDNFSQGTNKAQEYGNQQASSTSRGSGRGRRAASPSPTSFSQQERVAIESYLKVFDSLLQEKTILNTKLNNVKSGVFSYDGSTNASAENFKDIMDALKNISWSEEKLLLMKAFPQHSRQKASKTQKPEKKNLYGWEKFENSPWKNFFQEQEWLQMMEDIANLKKQMDKYRVARLFCGAFLIVLYAWEICLPEDKYLQQLKANEEKIALHIASKLISKFQTK